MMCYDIIKGPPPANRIFRIILAALGLLVCSLGTYLQLRANIGLAPWNALHQGLSICLPLTYGQATILISFLVLLADLLLHEPVGAGTLLDAVIVGWGVDVLARLDITVPQDKLILQVLVLLAGMVVVCFGQAVYMKAALGCGPRDALLIALGKRFSHLSVGLVNLAVFSAVLLISILLRSPVGIRTLIGTFCTGLMMDAVFHLLRFDPCAVHHEALAQTLSITAVPLKRYRNQ